MEAGRVSFDRAAEYYDRTRLISPQALQALTGAVQAELAGRGMCLEVGVGTGVIALELDALGLPMVGVDVAPAMLAKLIEKAGGRRPFPLLLADARALPFGEGSFAGAVVRHVLHIIRDWERAVDELVRVVEPGGVLLVSQGGYPPAHQEVYERFVEEAKVSDPFPGLEPMELEALDRKIAALGAGIRELEPFMEEVREPIGLFIDRAEQGLYSWTWGIEEEMRHQVAASIRGWAGERFGALDEPVPGVVPLAWRAYDLPAP